MSRCNTQTKSRTWSKPAIWLQLGHKLNKTNLKIKFAMAQRGYRTAERWSTKPFFFLLFFGLWVWKTATNLKDTREYLTGNLKSDTTWWEVESRSSERYVISRLMEISTLMKKVPNRTIEPLQSLHHCSDGYQPVHTRIDLAKKAKSLQAQSRT